jgi:5-deoxy-glucuronate isomerase
LSELLLRSGSWEQVTPASAGWNHLYFGVRWGSFASHTGDGEIALVPLGGRCTVEAEGQRWELGGREHVFAGMPWALYLPRDTAYEV